MAEDHSTPARPPSGKAEVLSLEKRWLSGNDYLYVFTIGGTNVDEKLLARQIRTAIAQMERPAKGDLE